MSFFNREVTTKIIKAPSPKPSAQLAIRNEDNYLNGRMTFRDMLREIIEEKVLI
jgi:hypothetical protein